MDVGAVLPVSLEGIRALSLGEAVGEGRVLEAKVTAMVSATLARLTIEGQSLDVTTPKPLPVGAMLTVKAEREDGQLRLVTQGPIRNPPPPAASAGAQALPDDMLAAVKTVLGKVQALAIEGTFGANPATAPPALPQNASATTLLQIATGQVGLPKEAPGQAALSFADALSSAALGAGPANAAPVASGQPPPASVAIAAGIADPANPQSAIAAQTLAEGAATLATPGLAAESGAPQTALPHPPPGPGHSEPIPLPLAAQHAMREAGLLPQAKGEAASLASMLAGKAYVEAAPGDEAVANPAPAAAEPGKSARPAPAGLPHGASHQPAASAADATTPALRDAAAETRAARPGSGATADAIAAYATSSASGGPGQADRTVNVAVQVPIYFPGNPQPLRLEITREEEDADEEDGGRPRAPSWTIRFAAEAGPLGMVHAAITYADAQVGVQLWAERPETAALFNRAAPQLQDALVASDLRVEALTIAQGRPPERPAESRGARRERLL